MKVSGNLKVLYGDDFEKCSSQQILDTNLNFLITCEAAEPEKQKKFALCADLNSLRNRKGKFFSATGRSPASKEPSLPSAGIAVTLAEAFTQGRNRTSR